MKLRTLVAFSLMTLLTFAVIAQTNETNSINEGSINDQFEYLLRKSGNFKGTNGDRYEAVRRSLILALQAHTNDSLNSLESRLKEANNTISTQQSEIETLKTDLGTTTSTLDATNKEKDSMSLFGMQMSKTGYNTLLWSIIAGLLALLLFFIYKFKNSNAITRGAKKSLEEIELEFEEHRRIALEREQKVRRQLQDELNKQKGSTS